MTVMKFFFLVFPFKGQKLDFLKESPFLAQIFDSGYQFVPEGLWDSGYFWFKGDREFAV